MEGGEHIKQVVARIGSSIGSARRMLVMALVAIAVGGMALAGDPPAQDYILGQEEFTQVATQILTYLGYAVVGGLTVLVAVIAARRGWSFLRRFF